jgi:hypothetical protein
MGFPKFILTVSIGLHVQRAINFAVAMRVHPALWKHNENAIVARLVFDSFGTLKAKDVEADVDGVVCHVCCGLII